MPIPVAARAVSAARGSRRTAVRAGTMPYQAMRPPRTREAMAKSTRADRVADSGTSTRGKYTRVRRCALPTTLVPARVTAPEKYVQGKSPR